MMRTPLPYYAERLQPYFGLIESALTARDPSSNDFDLNREHNAPNYVSRMCVALAAVCTERSGVAVEVSDVLRAESSASGHSDYHRKFALYCRELEQRASAR